MGKFIVKIIVCERPTRTQDDAGSWTIKEVEVTQLQYESHDVEGITAPYYTDDVVYVGIYSWEE